MQNDKSAYSKTYILSVDYKRKYAWQLEVVMDNYATFAMPHNGEDYSNDINQQWLKLQ